MNGIALALWLAKNKLIQITIAMKLKSRIQLMIHSLIHRVEKTNLFTFFFFLLISALLYSIVTRAEQTCRTAESFGFQGKDSLKNQPKIDVKVNRKYDEHGNLVQFDSTYSYVSSSDGNTVIMDMDSMMNGENFQQFFNHPFMNDPFGNNFFNDSLMMGFQNPFGNDPFEMHRKMMEQMQQFMQQMPQNRVQIPAPPQQKPTQKVKPKVQPKPETQPRSQPQPRPAQPEPSKENSNYITM